MYVYVGLGVGSGFFRRGGALASDRVFLDSSRHEDSPSGGSPLGGGGVARPGSCPLASGRESDSAAHDELLGSTAPCLSSLRTASTSPDARSSARVDIIIILVQYSDLSVLFFFHDRTRLV